MYPPQTFRIQQKIQTDDDIGGFNELWSDFTTLDGYIDLVNGTDINTVQNAYTEQSTHILVIPEYPVATTITDEMRVIDSVGRFYVVNYVDDPVGVHHHLEIYLTFGGVENGE